MSAVEFLDSAGAITSAVTRPRVGFLGVGWIGRNRLEAIAQSGAVEVAAIADPVEELRRKASEIAPEAESMSDLEALLAADLDAVVIATPSALHAEQAITALERGLAVFCQKPLGRNAAETRAVIETARRNDVLLGVDLSYRCMTEVKAVSNLVRSGQLGKVFAAEFVFHNAYGPDKSWFYNRKLSGGGCVIDLGIHLVDLALWALGFPEVRHVSSRLFAQGEALDQKGDRVEDFAQARLDLSNGTVVQIGCSWKLPAGRDAVISGTFYGTAGAASFFNLNGSFFEFAAERFHGTRREPLAQTNESWGGKAAMNWARQLAANKHYDPHIEELIAVAETLDRIYQT